MNKIFSATMIAVLGITLFAGSAFAKTKEGNDNLGGLDLNAYCNHLGLSNDSHIKPNTQNWYCTVSNNSAKNHIKIGEACEWQYGDRATVSREVVKNNPLTYNCFF